jgi:hypothetical protein
VRTALEERASALLNKRAAPVILALGIFSAAVYAGLASAGDLREALPLYLTCHAALAAAMLVVWGIVARTGRGGAIVLGAALVFRLVAAYGTPSLSEDVYRYVWDGRVQLHGVHPYRFAPDDPALADLRDRDWESINHPEVRTIYPPLAQAFFLTVAAAGSGPVGFRLALACVDFAVVLALGWLLGRLGLPRDRIVLYAWNPLAVIEVAGSGHVEPLAVVCLLLAIGWIIDRREGLSTIALAASVHVKLIPLVLIPGFWRRFTPRARLLFPVVLLAGFLPLAIWGPWIGSGLFAYAERWEYNAFLYAGVEQVLQSMETGKLLKPWIDRLRPHLQSTPIPWEFVYAQVWPREIARITVVALVGCWALFLALNRRLELPRELLLVLGAMLLLSPVVHPWYLLWILPLAAAYLSWGWLIWGMTVPLAYLGNGSDVPWAVRCIEYLPPILVLLLGWRSARSGRRRPRPPA